MNSSRLASTVFGVLVGVSLAFASSAGTERTIFVAGVDSKGNVIEELAADDVSITVDGKVTPIVSFVPARDPMDIAILDDDAGTGLFAPAVAQLIGTLGDRARYAIGTFIPALIQITGYTSDPRALRAGLERLKVRGRIGTGELQHGLIDVAARLKEQDRRRKIMIVFTVGEETAAMDPTRLMDDFVESGAMLNVIFSSESKLGRLTSDAPEETGGRKERIISDEAARQAVARICGVLLHQYALTYSVPQNGKSTGRIRVSTTRKGMTLLAPRRVPVR